MMLVDSNVIMYAAGAAHPNKAPSVAFLDRVARAEIDAAIDAEVLQEILHRYRAIQRWSEGRTVYDLARRLFPLVFPVSAQVLDAARSLLDRTERLTARDALHAAVVQLHELTSICSYDRDFDSVSGVIRVEPDQA
jgi:predicted nucleic acid-binding protein